MAPYSVLRTWLRRWLGLTDAAGGRPSEGATPAATTARVDELEARVDFLALALRRLRGRVTGGLRADPARDGEDGGPVSDAPAVQFHPRYSNAWLTEDEHRRLARAHDESRARDTKGDHS